MPPKQTFWQMLKALFRRKPKSPDDPFAERLVPVRRGPKGRSGAAVAEPEDESYGFFPPRKV